MSNSCWGCYFFFQLMSRPGGECHRFPPVPVNQPIEGVPNNVESVWPIVRETAWCGEHKKKEEDDER